MPGDVESVQGALNEEEKRQLLERCLCAAEENPEVQRALLLAGLQITELGRPIEEDNAGAAADVVADKSLAAVSSGGGVDRQWWRWQRLLVLQHLERLDTVLALYKGAYSPQAYAQLRDCTIAEAASAFAASQRWEELAMLLARHPYALLPSALDALAAAPETADPAKLAPLLQQLVAQQVPPSLVREADWVESKATVQELRAADQFGLLLATEPLAALSLGWRPPSSRRLVAWVCERALALDAATGQLPGAMALLEVGRAAVHYGEQSLNELLEAAHELSTVLRLATTRSGGGGDAGAPGEPAASAAAGPEAAQQTPAWQLRLREYAALEPLARLRALLSLLGTDGLAADLPSVVAPFLSRMDGVDTGLLLRQALEREAAARLSWAVRFVQAEAEQRCLFDPSAELAKAATAVVYGSAATDAWGLLEAALGAAGEAVAADEELGHEAAEAARDMLLTVRGHVTAARLLTKHGLATSARMVRDADARAAERLLRSLLARVARAKDSESRWVEVWMDLRTVRDRGLSQLPESALRREFCAALLRCGRHRLATSYLQGLEAAEAEALVLAAAREAFLSATGLGDAAVRQAAQCLEALPGSTAAQRELGRLEAAMKLAALGVELTPVQLHSAVAQGPEGSCKLLEQARMSGGLGRQRPCWRRLAILAAQPQLAHDADAVLRLTELLGAAGGGAGGDRHALVLQAALAAFGGGDVQQAEGMALQLAAARHEPAWELAAAVAGHPGVSGVPARQRLLSFALLHAPVEQLPALLEAWEAADVAGGCGCACWLRPCLDQPASMHEHPEQQLDQFFEACASSTNKGSSGASSSDGKTLAEAPALLASLLALGPRGLQRWEALLAQHQQHLSYTQQRQALLLGVTAALLLALRPSCMDASSAEAVDRQAEAARQLLELSPGKLLARWQEQPATSGPPLSRKGSVLSGGDGSTVASETASDAGSTDATLRLVHAQHHHEQQQQLQAAEEAAAAAAGEALQRFLSQLVSADDAQRVQQLLPGDADAAAALAASSNDPESRRQVVLKLAAAALGRPGGGVHASTSGGSSRESQRKQPAAAAGNGAGRKKAEEAGNDAAWSCQLDAAKALAALADALQLAQRYSVPAWEVRLAFVQSLLLTHCGPEAQQAVEELLRATWPALLQDGRSSVTALAMLLRAAWPCAGDSDVPRLALLLQLATECCSSMATVDASQGAAWEAAAATLSSFRPVAAALAAAAPALGVKAFLLPPLLMVSNWAGQQLDSDDDASKQQRQQQALLNDPLPSRTDLAQHLLPLIGPGNATQLAEAVAQLGEQQAAAREQLDGGWEAADAPGTAYPLSSSDVFGVLACKVLADDERDADQAVHAATGLFARMEPALVAAVASFAAAGGASPLGLPLVCPALDSGPREQLLSAALGALDQAGDESFAPAEKELVVQLRRQHALLATLARIRAAAGTTLSDEQMAQVGQAAEVVQLAEGAEAAAAAATTCLEQLLTAGCDALTVLSVAFELAGLDTAAHGQGMDTSLALVQAAAMAAIATALAAMGGSAEPGSSAASLSAGDAIQNLYGVMRALDAPSAARHPAAAPAVGDLRLPVWRQLQAHVAAAGAADLGGGAAEAEARLQARGARRTMNSKSIALVCASLTSPVAYLQVLELLGCLGASLWAGWSPPAEEAAAQATDGGFDHQRALLLARVVAALAAADWPSAAQQCGLAAGDFSSAENAEAALLRLVDVADSTQQLQAVVAVLQQALAHAFSPAQGGGDEREAGAHPLHRAWSACLHALLLRQRVLLPVLAALDEARAAATPASAQQQQQQGGGAGAPLLAFQEARSLVEAADASLGPAAAAALAALLPYPPLCASATRQLLEATGGSGAGVPDLAALPGMPALLLALAAEQAQPLLPALASSNQHTFRQLASVLVAQDDAVLWVDLGAGLTLRAAAVTSLAAQLAAARHHTPAAWLAMQFSGLHPLLRVLDSSASALRQLLQACSSAAPAGRAASAVVELPPAVAAALGPAHLAEDLLRGLPERCDAALQQLDLDLE